MKIKTVAAWMSTVFSLSIPALAHAVVVPVELTSNDGSSYGTIYGLMVVVFMVGIGLGIWVQNKLHH